MKAARCSNRDYVNKSQREKAVSRRKTKGRLRSLVSCAKLIGIARLRDLSVST